MATRSLEHIPPSREHTSRSAARRAAVSINMSSRLETTRLIVLGGLAEAPRRSAFHARTLEAARDALNAGLLASGELSSSPCAELKARRAGGQRDNRCRGKGARPGFSQHDRHYQVRSCLLDLSAELGRRPVRPRPPHLIFHLPAHLILRAS